MKPIDIEIKTCLKLSKHCCVITKKKQTLSWNSLNLHKISSFLDDLIFLLFFVILCRKHCEHPVFEVNIIFSVFAFKYIYSYKWVRLYPGINIPWNKKWIFFPENSGNLITTRKLSRFWMFWFEKWSKLFLIYFIKFNIF